jgi:hypothetical protein
VRQIVERRRELSRFLAKLRDKSVPGGKAPATSEFATARSEYDALAAQIGSERAKVLAAAKPTPKSVAPAISGRLVARVTQGEIDKSQASDWVNGDGKDKPDFVITLEAIP